MKENCELDIFQMKRVPLLFLGNRSKRFRMAQPRFKQSMFLVKLLGSYASCAFEKRMIQGLFRCNSIARIHIEATRN